MLPLLCSFQNIITFISRVYSLGVESLIAQSHSPQQKDDLKHLLKDLGVAIRDTERDVLADAGYDAIDRDADEIR